MVSANRLAQYSIFDKMEILASRRRQLMSTKSFRGTRKKSDSPNASTISIKMGSQSFRSRQGSVCSPVVLRNKIQTSPSLMRDKTHHGVKEKQNINVPSQTNFICDDLRRISKSLDCLNNDIMMQHREILRDVESKIPSVNKGIISDIDRIRENLHSFEFIVQNRDVESGLSSTISDDEIGEFTVKSVENLVSRSPWSPPSLNSSPYSISNMFSPGAKSQDSGIFFDDHRPHSCEVSLISPFKDGIADNDWTTCSGVSYVDMFDVSEEPCFNTPFKEVDQCHGYHSDENIESYGYQTVVNTLGADVDESWTLDTVNIDNVPVDKYESTTHKENLPRQDESYSERNSDEEQQRVLDTNDVDLEGSSDNCSIRRIQIDNLSGKFSSKRQYVF
ncbi:hypothetical protein KUTeg_021423 [Tegillarca granosa]|uniref:Uncharacterized protein n=1 Tax=Tegillarca granosa TaxID=220873 RepID=A0ABQ9E3J6_TEGGR|nr:hypothetical protein KUTeg_021423 [Tegillarca granosa]